MSSHPRRPSAAHAAVAATLSILCASLAHAGDAARSGKLLLTGGVNSLEGTAGGGLTPWALIGGYGTEDQIGANAFATTVRSKDYALQSTGVLLGIHDRVELSAARQRFDTRAVGGLLGLGNGYSFSQNIIGVKVKVAGDAVLEQDTWLPQIALGVQRKQNNRGALLRTLGARQDSGNDFYLSATRLSLDTGLLLNATLRATKANQTGILGFGSPNGDKYDVVFETSTVWLIRKNIALGAEFRQKPNHLAFKESNWADVFVAWTPNKNLSLTFALADLGNIVIKDKQTAAYLSVQVGF